MSTPTSIRRARLARLAAGITVGLAGLSLMSTPAAAEPVIIVPNPVPTPLPSPYPLPPPWWTVDTDRDGLADVLEASYGTSPTNPDYDRDKLLDGREVGLGTNPLRIDTDGDRLVDSAEVNVYGTDPRSRDTDGDALWDWSEVNIDFADPLVAEPGGYEYPCWRNPAVRITGDNFYCDDTDGDGLPDSMESWFTSTSPRRADTDGDGYFDGSEIAWGTDPRNAASHR